VVFSVLKARVRRIILFHEDFASIESSLTHTGNGPFHISSVAVLNNTTQIQVS